MAAKTPKQLVTEQFGSRAALVDAATQLVGGGKETRARLMGTTNKKLLRIHEVATTVQERFGGKAGLIDALAQLQFPGGNANPGWRTKMETFTVKRLLDLHRQLETKGAGRS